VGGAIVTYRFAEESGTVRAWGAAPVVGAGIAAALLVILVGYLISRGVQRRTPAIATVASRGPAHPAPGYRGPAPAPRGSRLVGGSATRAPVRGGDPRSAPASRPRGPVYGTASAPRSSTASPPRPPSPPRSSAAPRSGQNGGSAQWFGPDGAPARRPDRDSGGPAPEARSARDGAGYRAPAPSSRYRAQVDAAVERGRARTAERAVGERTQDLLARQLALISELEAQETDPERLDVLFRLDHLTVQLRRQDASLRALRGEEPVRWWKQPAPLSDVAIAAASEVEEYRRIEVLCLPTVEVAPWAVVDVVHLLAELLDNATMFSPPGTPVHVVGGTLPDGRILVDIHDGGPGMDREVLDQLNARLNGVAGLDAGETTTSGLMVVERLARRLQARVALFPWGDAGMTARVILPGKLVRPVVAANPRLKTLPRGR
jgi:hypothetical protein